MTNSEKERDLKDVKFCGRLIHLHIDDLLVDHRVQRNEVSEANTRRIAQNFDPIAFGIIIVSERPNGKYYVMDGQQRILALRFLGYQGKVPCMVHEISSKKIEAKEFLAIDDGRKCVKATDKFRVAVSAGFEPQVSIKRWLDVRSLSVGTSGYNSFGVIDFIRTLQNLWRIDEDASKEALLLQVEMNNQTGEPLHGDIHRAFWWLCHHGPSNNFILRDHLDKMKKAGGKVTLLQYINRSRNLMTVGGERAAGSGVLDLINKGRRVKFSIMVSGHGGKGYSSPPSSPPPALTI